MSGRSGVNYYRFSNVLVHQWSESTANSKASGTSGSSPDISEALHLHICINSENVDKSIFQKSEIQLDTYNNLALIHLGQTAYFWAKQWFLLHFNLLVFIFLIPGAGVFANPTAHHHNRNEQLGSHLRWLSEFSQCTMLKNLPFWTLGSLGKLKSQNLTLFDLTPSLPSAISLFSRGNCQNNQ